MQKRLFIFVFVLFAGCAAANAQGGKAEPKRIKFANGESQIVLTGRLSNGQEMEYVFTAQKGQIVTIKNRKTSMFDFRVYNEAFEFETEFESSPTLTFEIPETGDYLFFVRKKLTKLRSGAYSINLSIK